LAYLNINLKKMLLANVTYQNIVKLNKLSNMKQKAL